VNIALALEYARKHAGEACVVECNGAVAAQEYGNGYTADSPHALYSGTKSFWGVTALQAQHEGLLQLDEPVAETFSAWRDALWKRRVTLRMLLSLTAGYGFGGLGGAVPTFERALSTELRDEPGTRFTYGGIPLQVFGAVLTRKLEPLRTTPHDYLRARMLEPAGVTVARWRTLSDGTFPLPTGAFLTARNWLTYGRFMLQQRERFRECLLGSPQNPRYGLGWWLGAPGAPDAFYASGSGGQALYVVPSRDAVVVRFGKGPSYKHEAFLKRLLS
jgi:CubicO group peptidase (beta-lactamase class C family)